MRITVKELRDLTNKALRNYGYTAQEAKLIEEILLYSQLRGGNQGVAKLIGAGIPKNPEAGPIARKKDTKLSAILDGEKNHAMVVVTQATELALEKARAHGIGIVGTFNTNTSSGSIGYYARRIAEHGFVGLAFSSSPETVAAHGSYEPLFGTNPLAIAAPTESEPIVLDMATSAMPFFGLVEAKTAGRSIPAGIAYDKHGKPTTDPAEAMDGALLPFDKGYKGAGLSLFVQILAGPLVGAAFAGIGDQKSNWGHLIIAIDPDILGGREHLKESVTKIVEKMKGTKKLPGTKEIFAPGERGDRLFAAAQKAGTVDIEDNLLAGLKKAAGA